MEPAWFLQTQMLGSCTIVCTLPFELREYRSFLGERQQSHACEKEHFHCPNQIKAPLLSADRFPGLFQSHKVQVTLENYMGCKMSFFIFFILASDACQMSNEHF